MRNASGLGEGEPLTVTADTAGGRAEFRRTDDTSAGLVLDYDVAGIEVAVPDSSEAAIRKAVREACQREIDQMRAILRNLGDAITEQLDEEGRDPDVDQKSGYEDYRTWTDRRTAFAVDPSSYHSETNLDGYRGASDAKLVRKTVEVTILDRELQIRQLYDQMLVGVAEKRTAARQQPPTAPAMEFPTTSA